jgi:hypothetical protein
MRENGHYGRPDSVADDDGLLRVSLKAQWTYLDAGVAGHYGDVTAIDVDSGLVSRCRGSECDDSEPAMFLPGPRAVHLLPLAHNDCTATDAGRSGCIRHSSGPRPRPRRGRARRASAACGPVQAPVMSRLWARACRLGPRLRHEAKMAFKHYCLARIGAALFDASTNIGAPVWIEYHGLTPSTAYTRFTIADSASPLSFALCMRSVTSDRSGVFSVLDGKQVVVCETRYWTVTCGNDH